jgi:hypothetical protein
MEIFIKANGEMVKPTDMASSLIPMVACMKASGSMISSMGSGPNLGISIRLSMLATLRMVKNLEKVALNSKEGIMKEISSMANFMEKASITLQIQASFTKASLKPITWRAKVL